jgi:hypothetical protein
VAFIVLLLIAGLLLFLGAAGKRAVFSALKGLVLVAAVIVIIGDILLYIWLSNGPHEGCMGCIAIPFIAMGVNALVIVAGFAAYLMSSEKDE